MVNIPQLNNPVSGKGYQTSTLSNYREGTGGEQFDIIQLTKPLAPQDATERDPSNQANQMAERKDFLPLSVKIAKDPTMAVESLKSLINNDLLSIAKTNGYTELYGELDDLMKGLYLKPEEVLDEILTQEKQNTMFSGHRFFDIMRHMSEIARRTNNEDFRQAIGNVLKAINYAQNKQEILNALSSNMRFLSEYFAPNKALSEDLALLADQWGAADSSKYFDLLKSETLAILHNVSESLLNNERTQIFIPLIVHNLSRYNQNDNMISDTFFQLLNYVPSENMKQDLIQSFHQLMAFIEQKNGGEATQFTQQTSTQVQQQADSQGAISGHQNDTTVPYHHTTNAQINQPLNAEQGNQNQIPRYLGQIMSDPELAGSLGLDEESFQAPVRNYLLGKNDGQAAIAEILGSMITAPEMQDVLGNEIAGIRDMGTMVNYLNDILQLFPDIDERQVLYESLLEIVNQMAENEELPADKPQQQIAQGREEAAAEEHTGKPGGSAEDSTLNQLINFVDKNINHSALKSMHNYNATNLLQSLINAPGVFTPLAHFIIPIEYEETKSFGELWVDNDEESGGASASGMRHYHLFLTFDIEAVGRFEVDMRAFGTDVNITLLHPPSFGTRADMIVKRVNRIVAQSGYVARNFNTAPLIKPHNLIDVFPNIMERRTGFNVKV